MQTFLTAERRILEPLKKGSTTLISLIAVYFTFNMVYPKPLSSIDFYTTLRPRYQGQTSYS